jgi:hypothetical protein
MKNRLIGTSLIALAGATLLTGCVYRERVATAPPATTTVITAPAPSASPATVVVMPGQRVVTYPEGRYELYGNGTAYSPYYWVWVPSGVTTYPAPPALPKTPQAQ